MPLRACPEVPSADEALWDKPAVAPTLFPHRAGFGHFHRAFDDEMIRHLALRERIDARVQSAIFVEARQFRGGSRESQRFLMGGDFRPQRIADDVGRHLGVIEFRHRFEQFQRPRHAAGVAELTGDRADLELSIPRLRAEGFYDRGEFGLILLRNAGGSRLHDGNLRLRKPRLGVAALRGEFQPFFERFVPGHADAANDRMNAVAVALGIGQPFEQQARPRLRRARSRRRLDQTVRAAIVEVENPVAGHEFVRPKPHRPVAGGTDHHVAIAGLQQIHAGVEGREGGSISGVHRRRPAHQVEGFGDPR